MLFELHGLQKPGDWRRAGSLCKREYLLSKREDAEFGPQHPHHRAGVASPDGNPGSLRGEETLGSLGLPASSPAPSSVR